LNLAQVAWQQEGWLKANFITDQIAAISVGMVQDTCMLDLDYSEDNQAQVDFNFVLTKAGRLIEVQGTAEQAPIEWSEFEQMRQLAQLGVAQILAQI
jgi:ribonuclease PH